MMQFRLQTAAVMLLLFSSPALACPFCETGAKDAAMFIMSVLVPFALAGVFILLATKTLSKGNPAEDLSQRIFEAEGKVPIGESDEPSN